MIFTRRLLDSELLGERFRVVHVDISDHRDLGTVGRLELMNAALAFVHALRLARVLIRDRPAVVHVPLAQNLLGLGRDLMFVAICLMARARVVAHVHGGGLGRFLDRAPRWFTAIARALFRRCSAFVVMSRWQADRLGDVVPHDRVVVIPHGTRRVDSPPRPPGQAMRALYVSSHLHESKGLQPLVEAAVEAQRTGVTEEWEVVGAWLDEPTERETEARVAGTPGIRFRGALDPPELAEAYSRANVFVFPTGAREGFALVRIEAMAAGLPVITTEAGGGHEIVRDGVDGYIVDYDSPGEIVARLRELRENPDLLESMSLCARDRQREMFDERAFERAIAELWDRLVVTQSRPAPS